MGDDEKNLVNLAKSGNTDAFIALVDECKERIARIAFYITGSRDEAEEVAQEAFLRAFTQLGTLKPHIPFAIWVGRIAKNLSIDRIRKRKLPPDDLLDWGDEGHPEIVMDVRKAIMELPIGLRLPVTMLYFDSLQIEEISKILKIPQGTVKSRIFKAKEILRRRLA